MSFKREHELMPPSCLDFDAQKILLPKKLYVGRRILVDSLAESPDNFSE